MAQNTTISIPKTAWTQLTDANVTAITFQNIGGQFALIKGTTGATAPTDATGSIRYNPGQGERNVAMSDLFPGVTAVRLWAWCSTATEIMVSHA